jgi:hypothetical protein
MCKAGFFIRVALFVAIGMVAFSFAFADNTNSSQTQIFSTLNTDPTKSTNNPPCVASVCTNSATGAHISAGGSMTVIAVDRTGTSVCQQYRPTKDLFIPTRTPMNGLTF